MDIHKMLTELKAERELVDEAILALSRLDAGEKRRGLAPSMSAGDNLRELKKRRSRRTKNRSKPRGQN